MDFIVQYEKSINNFAKRKKYGFSLDDKCNNFIKKIAAKEN